jgi:hypothetical protein
VSRPYGRTRHGTGWTARAPAQGYAVPVTGTQTPAMDMRTLRWAVILLAVEAVGVGVLAGYVGWAAATAKSASTSTAVATPLITALFAVVLATLSYSLWALHGWARGPAIVLEMLLIPIGYTMLTGGLPWVGIPVIVIGLFGAGLLLAPSTRTALGLDR